MPLSPPPLPEYIQHNITNDLKIGIIWISFPFPVLVNFKAFTHKFLLSNAAFNGMLDCVQHWDMAFEKSDKNSILGNWISNQKTLNIGQWLHWKHINAKDDLETWQIKTKDLQKVGLFGDLHRSKRPTITMWIDKLSPTRVCREEQQ